MTARALGTLVALTTAAPAFGGFGYCSSPMAPSTYITKPRKPSCYNGCEQYEIDSYRRQIDQYYENLRAYLQQVEAFRKAAYDYAKCMAEVD